MKITRSLVLIMACAYTAMAAPTTKELNNVLQAIRDSDWNGSGGEDGIPLIGINSNLCNGFLGPFGLRNCGAHAWTVDVDPDCGKKLVRTLTCAPRFISTIVMVGVMMGSLKARCL